MAISVTQKNQSHTRGINLPLAGAVGAIGGYALKYSIPITKAEKDGRFKLSSDETRQIVKKFRLEEIEAIRSEKSQIAGADEFLKIVDKTTSSKLKNTAAIKKEVKKLPLAIQKNIYSLWLRVNERSRDARAITQESTSAMIKKIRPTGVFVFGLGIIAILGSLTYNIIKRKKHSLK